MARPKPQTADEGILQTFAGGNTDPQLLDHTDKRQLDDGQSFIFRLLSLDKAYVQIAPFVQCVRKYKNRDGEIKSMLYNKTWIPAEGLDGVYDDNGNDLGKLISERSKAKARAAQVVYFPVLAMYMTDSSNNIRKDFNQEVMYVKATSSIMQELLKLSEDPEEPWEADDLPPYAIRLTKGTAANGNPEYKLKSAKRVGPGRNAQDIEGTGETLEDWLGKDYKAVMAEAKELMARVSDDLDAEFELDAIKATFMYKGDGPDGDGEADDAPPPVRTGRAPRRAGDRPGRYEEDDDAPRSKHGAGPEEDAPDDDAPAPRGKRGADPEEDAPAPRRPRAVNEVEADEVAPRRPRAADDDAPQRRSRAAAALEAEEADDVPPPRARARR